MSPNAVVLLAVFFVSLLVLLLLDRLLRPGLRKLLDEILGLPPATDFYLRAFVTVLVLVILSGTLGTHSEFKDRPHFMEYIWAAAGRLQDVFQNLFTVLLVYVGLITVLMAALRRKQ